MATRKKISPEILTRGIVNFVANPPFLYGFIQGEDGVSYHFHIPPDQSFRKGLEVEFDVPHQSPRPGMRATVTNVRLTFSRRNGGWERTQHRGCSGWVRRMKDGQELRLYDARLWQDSYVEALGLDAARRGVPENVVRLMAPRYGSVGALLYIRGWQRYFVPERESQFGTKEF